MCRDRANRSYRAKKFHAALRETPIAFEAASTSPTTPGPNFLKADLLASWQTVMPIGEAKKKIFVDDEVLLELF